MVDAPLKFLIVTEAGDIWESIGWDDEWEQAIDDGIMDVIRFHEGNYERCADPFLGLWEPV